MRLSLTPTRKKNLATLIEWLTQEAGSQNQLSKELKMGRGGISEFANGKRDSTGLTLLPTLVRYFNRKYAEITLEQLVAWLDEPEATIEQLREGNVTPPPPTITESDILEAAKQMPRKQVLRLIRDLVDITLDSPSTTPTSPQHYPKLGELVRQEIETMGREAFVEMLHPDLRPHLQRLEGGELPLEVATLPTLIGMLAGYLHYPNGEPFSEESEPEQALASFCDIDYTPGIIDANEIGMESNMN